MISQLIINALVVGSGYALIAIGHNMIFGLMGINNFAHGELYMLGAFIAFTLVVHLGLNYYLALLLSIIAGGLLGAILDKLLFAKIRDHGHTTSALICIGLSIFIMNTARVIWSPSPRSIPSPFTGGPISLGSVVITKPRLFVILVTLVLILALTYLLQKTKWGKAFRATFQNPEAALLAGIKVENIYCLNTALGSALAAIAGALLGIIYIIEPTMGVKAIGISYAVAVAGGKGSFVGAVLMAYAMGLAESFGATYISSAYTAAFAFILLIITLIFKPEGLFGQSLR